MKHTILGNIITQTEVECITSVQSVDIRVDLVCIRIRHPDAYLCCDEAALLASTSLLLLASFTRFFYSLLLLASFTRFFYSLLQLFTFFLPLLLVFIALGFYCSWILLLLDFIALGFYCSWLLLLLVARSFACSYNKYQLPKSYNILLLL